MYINDLEEYVDFLIEHKISADAYMFMLLISLDELAILYKFIELNHGLRQKELNSLVERGYLINDNSVPNQYMADCYRVSPRFQKLLMKQSHSMVDELWDNYPPYLWIEGSRYNARNIEKANLVIKYLTAIKNSRRKHRKVLKALEYGKTHNLINVGLKKFVATEMWDQLELEMEENANVKQYGSKEF